jgi:TolB protein
MSRAFSLVLIALCLSHSGRAQSDSLVTTIQDIAWSPDGRYIYFSAINHKPDWSDFAPHKWNVYRYDMLMNRSQLVVDSAVTVAVAPSGDRIAVGKLVGKERHIHLANADGSDPVELTKDSIFAQAPNWSPDGGSLAFNRRFKDGIEICTIQVNGSGYRQITLSDGAKAYNPVWSPDGRSIVYYLEKGDGRDQIHVMRADGSEDRNVTNDTLNNYFPAWLDDGNILYTQDGKDGPSRAFKVDVHGREKKPMNGILSFYTRLSPDGDMIAFVDQEAGAIVVITRTTGSRVAMIRPPMAIN